MRILVATNSGGLDDMVSSVFARAPTFTIIEAEGGQIKDVKVLPNQFANAVHGAGVQAGQFIVSQGINVAVAGNFGPNVSSILAQAGVKTVPAQGVVRDVVNSILSGSTPAQQPAMPSPMPAQYGAPSPSNINADEKMEELEEKIARLEEMIKEIKEMIKQIKEE